MHKDNTQLEDAILETLVEEEPLQVNEIAHRIDDHPLTVEMVCARLHDRGKIHQLSGGQYGLTGRSERRHLI